MQPARGIDPYADTPFAWYGVDPVFQIRLERNMKKISEGVQRVEEASRLTYLVRDLYVPGDLQRHNLAIVFTPGPVPWAAGIAPCDYPSVFTDVERERLHLHGDGSLCLWASYDPPERRWHHGLGLHSLVEIARRHLLFEIHWWRTGGPDDGEWPVEDAPHSPDVWSAR